MKKVLKAVLLLVTVIALTACGKSFDSVGYVQGILDATTKEKYGVYIELTGSTEKEAKEAYEENIDELVSSLDDLELSDDLLGKYRQLFIDMYKETKYKVTENKDSKGKDMLVDVEIEPLLVFDDYEEMFDNYQEELISQYSDIEDEDELPDEDEILEQVFQHMYEHLEKKVSTPKYGKPVVITVKIIESKDAYEISDKDLEKLNDSLIDSDGSF